MEPHTNGDLIKKSSQRIARDILESAYSWYSERAGKTEIVNDGNSVE